MSEVVDLPAAFDAVIAGIAAQFPQFRTVAAEDESRTELALPAIVIQLSEIEPDLDSEPHTGQFPALVHFEARVVLGHRTPRVRREVAQAAGAVAGFVHLSRFGTRWGRGRVLACEPDDFSPAAPDLDIWRVEWVHSAFLGPAYELPDGLIPAELLVSFAPQIGVPNEAEYRRIDSDE